MSSEQQQQQQEEAAGQQFHQVQGRRGDRHQGGGGGQRHHHNNQRHQQGGGANAAAGNMGDANAGDAQFLPDTVRSFVIYFRQQLREKNVMEIQQAYENSFNKLTDRFYKTSPWPHPNVVAPLVDNDMLFNVLYSELFYRHVYSKLQPTLVHRFESWENYTQLFNAILSDEFDAELPNQWLWDIMDEFIYQFQSFCHYRSKVKSKSPEELAILVQNRELWNPVIVLHYLHLLIRKSNIVQILQIERNENEDQSQIEQLCPSTVSRMLGYFSIVGLLRVNCLMGDYYNALKVLENVDLSKKSAFMRVGACHITTYYYLGFAYLMTRRYVDAIKTFCSVLLFISRTKNHHTRSYQYDQILKKNEQMFTLLSMAQVLCSQRIDENLHVVLRDKYADKMARMQRGEEAAWEEQFSFACPKFINPAPPNYDDVKQANQSNMHRLQMRLFLTEVSQQQTIAMIRSYLKLYSTISTTKLASYLQISEEDLRMHLFCMKHKSRSLTWSESGPPASGKLTNSSDIDFYLHKDVIHIVDTRTTQRRYADYFTRQIRKFQDIVDDLNSHSSQSAGN